MPDDKPADTTTTDPPAGVAATAAAALREAVGEDTDDGAPPAAADGADTTTTDADGADGADADTAAPLSDDDLTRLATDPRVIEAVLASNADSIGALVDEVLTARGTEAEQGQVRAAQQATLDEALKKAREEGDFSEIGRLAADAYERAQQRAAVVPDVRAQVEEALVDEWDDAITTTFAPEIEQLSEVDLQSLNTSMERGGIAGVLTDLLAKREARLRGEWGEQLSAAEKATRNAATADKARGDGSLMLPGGANAAQAAQGSNVGALIREGLRGALADVEE